MRMDDLVIGENLTAAQAHLIIGEVLGCFVPGFAGASLSSHSKDALWDKFFTGAPRRQSGCVVRQAFAWRPWVWSRRMALRIVSSLRITATRATFFGRPLGRELIVERPERGAARYGLQ